MLTLFWAALLLVLLVAVLAAPSSSTSLGFDVSELDEATIRKIHWRHRRWVSDWLKANPTKAGVVGVWRFPPYGRFTSVGAATIPSLTVSADGDWSSKRLRVDNRGRLFVRPSFVEVKPGSKYKVTFTGGGETPLSFSPVLGAGQVLLVFNYPRQKWRFGGHQKHRIALGTFRGSLEELNRTGTHFDGV